MGMAEIELGPLSDRLDDDEMKTLNKLLEQAGVRPSLSDDQTTHTIAKRLSEDAMTEFMDRLEAHDMAADIYLPVEFEGRLHVGDYRVASGVSLSEVLDDMKEELSIEDEDFEKEEEDDEEEEEADEGTVIEAQLRNIWQLVVDACSDSVEKNMALHLRV
jgi:cell division protein YceG involved in septum cleavage